MLHRRPSGTTFAVWFLLGAIGISVLQWSHAQATGDIGGLIKVGSDHPLAEVIQAEVPGIPVAPGLGHDGQIYYAIGLDLTGQQMPARMEPTESAAYRYRRIGYPAASSLLGLLDGRGLVWGMVVVNAVSAGLATAAAAAIAQHFRRTPLAALAVVLNPGVWLSALLLTIDNLALAAGLLAILAFLKGRLRWTLTALAVAVLTKEVSFVFAAGLAGFSWWARGDRRRAGWLVLGSLAPMAGWLVFVQANIGGLFASGEALGPPLAGLFDSAATWPNQALRDNLLNAVTMMFLAVAAFGLFQRQQLWRWLTWPWVAIGLISSRMVWTLGNNAVRAFAPLIVLAVLGLVDERIASRVPSEPGQLGADSSTLEQQAVERR